MIRRTSLAMISAALLFVPLAVPAAAPSVKSVAGTYSVVKVEAYGENARGQMILGADGRYVVVLGRATLPKFAAGSRTKGTAEENKAVVEGSIAHAGKYTIDDGGKSITFHMDLCTFPNWDGTTTKRALKVEGDKLTYTVTAPSAGGSTPSDVVWKRVK